MFRTGRGGCRDHPGETVSASTILNNVTKKNLYIRQRKLRPTVLPTLELDRRQRMVQGATFCLKTFSACMVLGAAYGASMVVSQSVSAGEDYGGYGEIPLQASALMQEHLPEEVRKQLPVFVKGDSIEGKTDGLTVIEGNAELRNHNTVIKADKLEYDRATSETKANGNVLINSKGDRFYGPEAQMNLDTRVGHFDSPKFDLLQKHGTGDARRVEFKGPDLIEAHEARYSTCSRPFGAQEWKPDWLVRAKQIDLDKADDTGTAYGGVLEFQGVPILAAPFLTFPLSDERKSGLLSPSFGVDSTNGVQISQPYYLNLAPNYDATITPNVMSKRGLDLEGEFRYLYPSFAGQVNASVMPNDKLRDDDRWWYAVRHQQRVAEVSGSPVLLRLNLNRVSDGYYWRDFDRLGTSTSSRLLRNDAALSWSRGPWGARLGTYTYQTLQDPDSIITPPYNREPNARFTYSNGAQPVLGLNGWNVNFYTDFTRFKRSVYDTSGESLAEGGDRTIVAGEVSRRWGTSGWYVEPKFKLNSTLYNYDDASGIAKSATRTLPTFSVDSGMVFERPTSFFGRGLTQTLEPRAFFTWTPYKDQSDLPNFDSAARTFNLSSMYTENAFGGNDRISDTRGVTLGVSSRLIDPDDGAELVRLGFAQRYLFQDQNVTLPGGTALTERASDMLLSARLNWNSAWSLDSTVQFSPERNESVRSTVGARFSPGPYRSVAAAYRVQKDVSKYLDVSWQWPLAALFGDAPPASPGIALGPNQWYTVGRMNYSILDKKMVTALAGFEYDAGCWIGRVVLKRTMTSSSTADSSIMFQLEFTDFSRIGSGAGQSLRSSVRRYQDLREDAPSPSRYEQYD